jgi:hypothetical protein
VCASVCERVSDAESSGVDFYYVNLLLFY